MHITLSPLETSANDVVGWLEDFLVTCDPALLTIPLDAETRFVVIQKHLRWPYRGASHFFLDGIFVAPPGEVGEIPNLVSFRFGPLIAGRQEISIEVMSRLWLSPEQDFITCTPLKNDFIQELLTAMARVWPQQLLEARIETWGDDEELEALMIRKAILHAAVAETGSQEPALTEDGAAGSQARITRRGSAGELTDNTGRRIPLDREALGAVLYEFGGDVSKGEMGEFARALKVAQTSRDSTQEQDSVELEQAREQARRILEEALRTLEVSICLDTTHHGNLTPYQFALWLADYTRNVVLRQFPTPNGGYFTLMPFGFPSLPFPDGAWLEMGGIFHPPDGGSLPVERLIYFELGVPGSTAMTVNGRCKELAVAGYFKELVEGIRQHWRPANSFAALGNGSPPNVGDGGGADRGPGRPELEHEELIYRLAKAQEAEEIRLRDHDKPWKEIAKDIVWQLGTNKAGIKLLEDARKRLRRLESSDPDNLLAEVRELRERKEKKEEN